MDLVPEDDVLQRGEYRVVDTFEGIAGIYGHGLTSARGMSSRVGMHGRKNDLGETWNPKRLTVAHRHWKPGTLVRVTNLENGYTAVARVANRIETIGRARLLDVSPGLGVALDFGYLSRAKVRVELLAPAWGTADKPPDAGDEPASLPGLAEPPPAEAGQFALRCGVLADQAQAEALAAEIGRMAPPSWVEAEGERFRVLAAPTHDRAEAEKLAEKVRTQGYEAEVVER